MDQVKSNFYENQILEAIETVANGIVSKLKFDQTILCTITDDSKKRDGIYIVSDGTSTFMATSGETNYSKDMRVYVLIPQGDSDNQKTIIGKYVDDSATAVNYISAIDSFIEVKSYKNTSEYSLLANHPTQTFIDIPLSNDDVDDLKNNVNSYNCVGIQAKFKTDLAQEIIASGSYGLVLTLYGTDITSNIDISPRSYGIDCSDMYGDPYNYNFYYTQSRVFELPEDFSNVRINRAIVSFYQRQDFKTLTDGEKKELPYKINLSVNNETTEMIKNPNLFVKDVEIKFGYSLSEISGECIKLYSLNDEKYLKRADTKDIQLKWFIQNGVKEKVPYTVVDTVAEAKELGLEDHYSIYWYRQEVSDKINDNLAGVYWNIIPEGIYNDNQYIRKEIQKTEYNPDTDENELVFEEDENGNQIPVMTILPELMYGLSEDPDGRYAKKDDKEDGDLILATEKNTKKYSVELQINPRYDVNYSSMEKPYQYSFSPDGLLSQEKIKAILVRNEYKEVQTPGEKEDMDIYIHFEDASKYFEAKEVAYINANPGSLNLDSVQFIRNMRLKCQDIYNGIYKVYNSVDNTALGNESGVDRILNVIFDTYSTRDIPTAEAEGCSIKWKIPKNNSMIEPVDFSFKGPMIVQKEGASIEVDEAEKEVVTEIKWTTGDDNPYYECGYDWSSSIAGTDDWHEGAILSTHYRIKTNYNQSYNNNTIICEITKYKKKYIAEIELLFGESGTNGTGYTLSIRLDKEYDLNDKPISLTPVASVPADTNKKVRLIATLLDQYGNDITDKDAISWSFKNNNSSGLVLSALSTGDCDISYNDESISVSECYGIVMATQTVKWKEKSISLQAYLPIGIRPKDNDVFTYNGTSKIIYNAQGSNSTYQQNHTLFNKNNEEITVNKWQVKILDEDSADWTNYIPYFVLVGDEPTNILSVRGMYFNELSTKQMVIQALDDSNNVLYQQSILYDQNRFGNALFNEWDGSLVIDETGNKILSALIGAGKKDTNNTFSGVLIGDFLSTGSSTKTGLLGFKDSVETFGFHTDGTAFIGKSGLGRIEFDGQKGIISSAAGNTILNLTSGKILLSNDNNTNASAQITLDSEGGSSGYFSIKDVSSDSQLIYIGPDSYYLQSKDYSGPKTENGKYKPGCGVRFDLNSGQLVGYDFLIKAGSKEGESIIIDSSHSTTPLQVGGKFSVSWDGTMKATGGTFSGTLSAATGEFSGEITAETGTIGGWTINKYGLHNGGTLSKNESTNEIQYSTKEGQAVFSPQGATLDWTTATGKQSLSDIVFNIGTKLAIDKNGVLHATGAQLGGYTTSTDFEGFKTTVSDINTLIGKMNSSYGSIIKFDGDLGSTATFLVKGDDVSGYGGEGYYNSNNQNFYSNYNKENDTYDGLISAEDGHVYYDLLTSQMYLYKDNQYSAHNVKFFNVSKEGLLMANNAVISGTIYATNGWFSGGISASEGHFGNWEILNTGELKGTPSAAEANYSILLNPNYSWSTGTRVFTYTHSWMTGTVNDDVSDDEEDTSSSSSFTEGTVQSKTVTVRINSGTTITQFIKALEDEINNFYPYPEDPAFDFDDLSVFAKTILRSRFFALQMTLLDTNIFKLQQANSIIFGIDGFGRLNWNFNDSSGVENSRFSFGSNIGDTGATSKGLVLNWLDWNSSKTYSWSFLEDGSFVVDKIKTVSYTGSLGGFQLNSENMVDKFWNNSLFTTNTINNENYVGFIRAAGSSSKNLSNVFIGCKQLYKTTWPSNIEWSDDADYNFYIRFDGKARFESFHTKKYSDQKYGIRPNGVDNVEYVLGARDYPWSRIILGAKENVNIEERINCIRLQSWAKPFQNSDQKFYTVANIGLDTTPSPSKHTNFNRLYFKILTHDFFTNYTDRDYNWSLSQNETSAEIFFEADYYGDNGKSYAARFAPSDDNSIKLGSDQLRWKKIYTLDMDLTTANFETAANLSDARLKDVQNETLLSKILTVYDNLKPVVYKYKNLQENETHSRTHVGFLAQEVEQTIMDTGLSSEDYAIVQIAKTEEAVPGCEDGKKYYLNYNELHGLHTLKNQEQDKRILELEQKVQYLENKILELSGKGV